MRQEAAPSLFAGILEEGGKDMNDAEIEAAIVAKHRDRMSEEEADASAADEVMEEPIEEHFRMETEEREQVRIVSSFASV